MKSIRAFVFTLALLVPLAWGAGDGNPGEPRGERPPPSGGPRGMGMRGGEDGHRPSPEDMLIHVILNNPNFGERLGVTEEQRAALQGELRQLVEQNRQLQEQLKAQSMEQARLLLAESTDETALMAKVEETGRIRTEQAKNKVRAMLVLKRNLSAEQIEKARSFLRERMEQRRPGDGEEGMRPGEALRERWKDGQARPWHNRETGAESLPPPPPPDELQ